tara:strand:- start:510 stop:1166 length:657 start_codon:yes stop_codon:yes gene_type:complete
MNSDKQHIVVCGTDTDVGKTVVSSLLVQGLKAIYWKPIQSGLEEDGDTGRVIKLLNLEKERYIPEIYKFKSAVSPHWAAEIENKMIDPKQLKIPKLTKPLIIETAGGVMVPLNREWLQIDQLQIWKLPIVLVARSGLGTLNHTLLTLEALRERNIPIMGLILNGPLHPDNPSTLEQIGNIPIIAQLPTFERLTGKELSDEWSKQNLGLRFKSLMRTNQ